MAPPEPLTVGISVVNYHSSDDVAGLLGSLPRAEGVRLIVAVVDNSTSSDEVAALQAVAGSSAAEGLDTRVIAAPTNGGYAAGNNLGVAAVLDAGADVGLVINPDVRWVEGSWPALAATCRHHDDDLVALPTLEDGHRSAGVMRYLPFTGYFRADAPGSEHPLAYVSGHCFAFTAEVWRRLGGLSEDYFLYCEEIDAALRLRALGGGIATFTDGLVEHSGGGAINAGAAGRSRTSYLYGTRARMMLHRRFARLRPYLVPLMVLRSGWAASLALRGQWGPAGWVLRGIGTGLVAPMAPGQGSAALDPE